MLLAFSLSSASLLPPFSFPNLLRQSSGLVKLSELHEIIIFSVQIRFVVRLQFVGKMQSYLGFPSRPTPTNSFYSWAEKGV